MIAGTVYYLATPIRSCMRNRSEAGGDGPCVQSGGRPTCTQKMKSYAGAAWAGVQKAVGQLLSATASELIGEYRQSIRAFAMRLAARRVGDPKIFQFSGRKREAGSRVGRVSEGKRPFEQASRTG